jgi:predicted RND superfamily exporter protein
LLPQGLVFGRGRAGLFVAAAGLTLVLGALALGVRHERNNESMIARTPDAERAATELARAFGGDEIVIVSLTHPQLLEPPGLRLLDELTRRIAALPGVDRATSLCNADQLVHGPDGATVAPLLPEGPDAGDAAAVRAALDRNPHLTGLLVSADRRTAGILIEVEQRAEDTGYRDELVEALRDLKRELSASGAAVHLTGITVQKHDTTEFVRRDQRTLLPLSVLVLAGCLGLATRRVAGVVLPLLGTAVTLVWTLGLYGASGLQINVITVLLPPMIMVLSIANTLYVYFVWAEDDGAGDDRAARARRAVERLLVPCFLTTLTTALGLASLVVSDMPAVRQFGLFGALGVLLSFVVSFTLLPAVLSLLRPPARTARASLLESGLLTLVRLSTRRPGTTLLAAALLSLVGVAGMALVRNNTDLVRFLKADSELYRDTMFIDRQLVGANAIELIVARNDGEPLTSPDDLRRLDELASGVRGLPDVTSVLGLPDLMRQLHRAEQGLDRSDLPQDRDLLLYYFDLLEAADRQDEVRRVVTADFRRTRLIVRVRAIGTAEAASLFAAMERLGRTALGSSHAVTPSGGFHQVAVDSNRLVASQVESFSLAFVTVLLALGAAFRSARLVLAGMVPTLIPLSWTGGLMGWCGIDLSTATAMVAPIALGIAVDQSIQFLWRFRREHTGDLVAAIARTTTGTGRLLVVSCLTLAFGFWVGTLGSFKPTIYFSVLTGVTMISALACSLLVLPACLVLLRPGRSLR